MSLNYFILEKGGKRPVPSEFESSMPDEQHDFVKDCLEYAVQNADLLLNMLISEHPSSSSLLRSRGT